ncbi:MAG: hypothetical protein V4441_07100 [Pseudomonadota bacterium]
MKLVVALTDFRPILTFYVAVALLLPLASCLAPDKTEPVAPVVFGLRGPVDDDTNAEIITASIAPVAPVLPDVPSIGPDETVASASIAESLNKHPQFDIDMSFAPGDGATSLKAALSAALAKAPPSGMSGKYRLRGTVAVANTDTGKARVTINWLVARADGRVIGSVDQQSDTHPSDIAAYWGDFALSSAKPAAEGIFALLSTEARLKRNAS